MTHPSQATTAPQAPAPQATVPQAPAPQAPTPQAPTNATPSRSSNLELYRIVAMFLIVANHFVVSSGVMSGPMAANPRSGNTFFLLLFGMWGKTAVNAFVLITGYFMCKSRITLRKFAKLFLEVLFYNVVIFTVFAIAGRQSTTPSAIAADLLPVWNLTTNFVSCYIVFYLLIPFLNILVQNMTRRQHILLLAVLVTAFTLMGTVPGFDVTVNYVPWFCVLYLISSYLRLYPAPATECRRPWGWLTLAAVLVSMGSVVAMQMAAPGKGLHFMWEANKLFPLATAVFSFLWFKNLPIRQSRLINAVGSSTFAVLLIHAGNSSMPRFLWRDTLHVPDLFTLPTPRLILISLASVAAVFLICILIDRLRLHLLERPILTRLTPLLDRWETKLNSR